jgi:hypothetical protein
MNESRYQALTMDSPSSFDVPYPIAAITQLVDERQRLHGEIVLLRYQVEVQSRAAQVHSAHALAMSEQMVSLRQALHAVLQLQHVGNDNKLSDEADVDDAEESILELYELRRWKAQFAVDQTRSLIDRVDALTAQVHHLEQVIDEQKKSK